MSTEPSIQYRPPHKGAAGFGFEDGVIEDVDIDESYTALLQRQAMARTIQILTARSKTAKQAGYRIFIMAHKLKLGICDTQAELAVFLGISEGRVSQILKDINRETGL